MTSTTATLAKNISLAVRANSVICLIGERCYDRFITPRSNGNGYRPITLERLIQTSVNASAQWRFDPSAGTVELFGLNTDIKPPVATGELPKATGQPARRPLAEVLNAFAQLPAAPVNTPQVLVIDAHLLFEDPHAPHQQFFVLLQLLEYLARELPLGKLIVLRCHRPDDLPEPLAQAPRVKHINIPEADRDDRHAYAMLLTPRLAPDCGASADELANTVSGCTEGWPLDKVDALLKVAQDQKPQRLQDFEELAVSLTLGTTHSPWTGQIIRNAVRQAPQKLEQRVLGQDQAISSVLARLRQSVSGLSGAHQGRSSQTPRAIFFFAGPTGTGKTELAKALSEVVYGQEQLLRFDCGELREEHAVARLIGAPPGYIGHDNGGELTEGIRKKPNSLVLMDEIEKAAPRLLDTFLGVLDDGRLTSGQGHTAYFGQSMIVFTSNLGMYEEVRLSDGNIVRRPRFDYDTPFADMQAAVRDAVRDEFVNRLGRPELLGRLGGAQNIIVFDFLRDLHGVTRKFLHNVAARCASSDNIHLQVGDDVVEHIVTSARNDAESLLLGGRGLAQHLERLLILPLSDYLFETAPNGRTIRVGMGTDGVRFRVA